ncbi:MAG: hypothetical protein COA44_14160 [Arcobacter sp.]|nr:MAG: hypothetical protein COA44_14160 [Arcobacter sp.]
MQTVLNNLSKRRKMMFYILMAISVLALIINYFFNIPTTSYFGEENNIYIVYGLISYKIIELCVLYLIFYRRHLHKLTHEEHTNELLAKFEKNAKRFFMLVPHGSTIFGMISYKLTANIYIFLLFMLIASIALFLVKPKKSFT